MKLHRTTVSVMAGMALAACSALSSQAQSNSSSANTISVTEADRAAVAQAKQNFRHALYARTPAGVEARRKTHTAASTASTASTAVAGSSFAQYPGDLSNQGGAVVDFASSHAVYFTNNGACSTIGHCWANPEGFLHNLGVSEFIHVVDQYVKLYGSQRYTVGSNAFYNAKLPKTLSTSDLLAILHAVVASKRESGYRHVYHLFLPPGVDTCFDGGQQCYSPDNFDTFVFCAYHGSVDYGDLNAHVLVTVEPYQAVDGCSNGGWYPNGQLANSTYDTLSHELFETITDPDGDAFWNASNMALFGQEIADECQFVDAQTLAVSEPVFAINGKLYKVQSEYSNERHACAIAP